tara:strand:+ start:980 stop:1267 length:288 start_codon:yes stop_codon:yes gene_type:complete
MMISLKIDLAFIDSFPIIQKLWSIIKSVYIIVIFFFFSISTIIKLRKDLIFIEIITDGRKASFFTNLTTVFLVLQPYTESSIKVRELFVESVDSH